MQNRILLKDRFPIRKACSARLFPIFELQRLTASDVPAAARKQGKARVNAQAGAEPGDGDPPHVTASDALALPLFTRRNGNSAASSLFC